MKRCLPTLVLLFAACTPEKAEPPAPPTPTGPHPQAAARLDSALMHDYELLQWQHQEWQRPTPPLPPRAEDATFLRRACIDLAGRLPHADEARRFLADRAADKRARLTDALTREPGAAEVRYRMLAETFRVRDDAEVIAWLRQAAAEDRPYADIITHMIGGGKMSQRDDRDAMRTSVETAYSLLGQDVYCAMCHDHPFHQYTQRECYSFAACFAGKGKMKLPADYLYRDGKPGEVVPANTLRLPQGNWMTLTDDESGPAQVARWMVQQENSKRYAVVAALRAWSALFGMPGGMANHTLGGMEETPPWHGTHHKPDIHQHSNDCFSISPRGRPTWVDKPWNTPSDFSQASKLLVEEFLRCNGRLGEFQRILARTDAYSRASHEPGYAWDVCYLVPSPQVRRLPSEVIWKVCSGQTDDQLPEIPPQDHPLRMLGRGTREWTDESLAPISHALARFMIAQTGSVAGPAGDSSAEDLFLTLLGRQPGETERAAIVRHAASSQDVAWALLNTAEFMFRP